MWQYLRFRWYAAGASAKLPRRVESGDQRSDARPATFRFGPFDLDVRSGELRKRGTIVRLPEQPFQILVVLLEHPGDVVSREEIRSKLWPGSTVVEFEHSINSAVKRLRDALRDSADKPRYIETLPRRGYKFICPVERLPGEPPRVQKPTDVIRDSVSRQDGGLTDTHSWRNAEVPPERASGRRRVLISISAALALLALFGWIVLRPKSGVDFTPKRLTANPSELPVTGAAISPDAKYVAYSDRAGIHLYVVQSGETRHLVETAGFEVSRWSPDATRIVAIRPESKWQLSWWEISIFGGAPRKSGITGALSPDGTRDAFLKRNVEGAPEIWVQSVSGENPQKLPGTPVSTPYWSPDGSRIAWIDHPRPGDYSIQTWDPKTATIKAPIGLAMIRRVGSEYDQRNGRVAFA
jgi:DNA-binding winged helix-turn-helix (wHTH) protein